MSINVGSTANPHYSNLAHPDAQFLGLRLLYQDSISSLRPEVDIVAIQGFDDHPERTWTAENGVMWLRDLLPQSIRTAKLRIFSWGGPKLSLLPGPFRRAESISSYSTTLLSDLNSCRVATRTTQRPIVFIAHDIGGLILKTALCLASAGGSNGFLRSIYMLTTGIIFLATPHQGFSKQRNLILAAAKFFGIERELRGLLRDTERLASLNNNFVQAILQRQQSLNCTIVSAYETLPSSNGSISSNVLVPMLSAVIPGIESQPVPLHADHQRAAKFTGPNDPNYIRISECLETMLKAIVLKQPQQTWESATLIGMNRTETADSSREVTWSLVETGDRASNTNNGADAEPGIPLYGEIDHCPTSIQQLPAASEGAVRLQAAQATSLPGRSVTRISDQLKYVARDQLFAPNRIPGTTSQTSSQFSNVNSQTTISRMTSAVNETVQQVTGSSLRETSRIASGVPVKALEAAGSVASTAVSPWVKASTVAAVGGALGIGAVNSGAAWRSANAASRGVIIADRNAAAAEQNAIAAMTNAEIAARKLDFEIAESQKEDGKSDEPPPSGSMPASVAGASTSVRQQASRKPITSHQSSPAPTKQLSTPPTIIADRTSQKASSSFKVFLDNVTKLQEKRRAEKQQEIERKAKNISWFKRRQTHSGGISAEAEADLNRNLAVQRAKHSRISTYVVTRGTSASSEAMNDPKGKGKAKDIGNSNSESSSTATSSDRHLSNQDTGPEALEGITRPKQSGTSHRESAKVHFQQDSNDSISCPPTPTVLTTLSTKGIKEPTSDNTTTVRLSSEASSSRSFTSTNENDIQLETLSARDDASPHDNQLVSGSASLKASTSEVPQTTPENIDWVEWYSLQDSTKGNVAESSNSRTDAPQRNDTPPQEPTKDAASRELLDPAKTSDGD